MAEYNGFNCFTHFQFDDFAVRLRLIGVLKASLDTDEHPKWVVTDNWRKLEDNAE